MARSTSTSLADFAAAQPNPNKKCQVCTLPDDVLAQVRAAKDKIPGTVITRWLNAEHGLSLQPDGDSVRNCNRNHA